MPNNNPSKLAKLRMPDYSGSWWQFSHDNITSLRIGKWTPVQMVDIPGGSLFKAKPSLRFESMPAVSPNYNGYEMRTKFYFVPYRLYIPAARKNLQIAWNQFPKEKFPELILENNTEADGTNGQKNIHVALAGSLLDRLHMLYGETYTFNSFNNKHYVSLAPADVQTNSYARVRCNLLPLLAYVDAWMYGEYNPQDKNIPVDTDVINFARAEDSQDGTSFAIISRNIGRSYISAPILQNFVPKFAYGEDYNYGYSNSYPYLGKKSGQTVNYSLQDTALVGETLRLVQNWPLTTKLNFASSSPILAGAVRANMYKHWDTLRNMYSAIGLLPLTYKGDYFTSWYSEEGINILESYVVQQGMSMMALRKRNDDFMVAALSLISGNRFIDYLQFVFDTDLELKDHPIMVGYDKVAFGMVDVYSNANTGSSQNDVLGGTAGKVINYNDTVKPFSFKTKEPGLLLVCSGIVPTVSYAETTPRFMFARALEDVWHPQYQSQGFRRVFRGERFNPFVASDVEHMPDTVVNPFGMPQVDGAALKFTEVNKIGLGFVPLGYQYMTGSKIVSGAMKTDGFRTWSMRPDLQYAFGPEESYNPFGQLAIETLTSTYVDAFSFNKNFAIDNAADSENFVVKFSLDCSVYQPISKQLISKTI